jgi:hypothetical protein
MKAVNHILHISIAAINLLLEESSETLAVKLAVLAAYLYMYPGATNLNI